MNRDKETAQAFANSWNNLPGGSVYTYDQFSDWLEPLTENDVKDKTVLELGCGNGSLMTHLVNWNPKKVMGIDLGDSVKSAKENLQKSGKENWQVKQADIVSYAAEQVDIVYSIGVLHHMKDPHEGFKALLKNTKPGGKIHAWVYAHEGNFLIRFIVEPLRKISSKLPWWFTKYFIAQIAVIPYFFYAKLICKLNGLSLLKKLPLYDYSLWIGKREFSFFRHVAFDQLVTPQTVYIKKQTIEKWLQNNEIDQKSSYIIFRNGNSWKFGGKKL